MLLPRPFFFVILQSLINNNITPMANGKCLFLTALLLAAITIAPVHASSEVQGKPAQTRLYTYYVYSYNDNGRDTSLTFIAAGEGWQALFDVPQEGAKIAGYAQERTYIVGDSLFYQLSFEDGCYYYTSRSFAPGTIEWQEEKKDATTRYVTSINSNRIELMMSDKYNVNINPIASYGQLPGLLTQYVRNGQVSMEFAYSRLIKSKRNDGAGNRHQALLEGNALQQQKAEEIASRIEREMQKATFSLGTWRESRSLSRLKQQRLIQAFRIFDTVQLHWEPDKYKAENEQLRGSLFQSHGDNARIDDFDVPYDTVFHFAGGTVIMKRVILPSLPQHYQWFAELHEQSNGDAYDRTGSLFVIPMHNTEENFFRGMIEHPDSIAYPFIDRQGNRFQGIASHWNEKGASYLAPLEMVRFFTPFGVKHFNDRVHIEELEWQDEAYYKQEITELASYLHGDVWIGLFIGNYDRGGHKVTLDLKAYPQSASAEPDNLRHWALPLFNTCNVLEMAGQNYGKLFGTDSLTVCFYVPDSVVDLRLRYITTGHGGWDTGDEFIPKENHILIDGKLGYSYVPWRSDCGTYRDKNPVSGNFWNGVSSSDYSRSGWCPGTATQPVYFDLSWLSPGYHTITIAIPQGAPVEGGFCHWNVSGALIGTVTY